MAGLLLLSACSSEKDVTENNLPEPGKDGVAPVLTIVTIQPDGVVKPGQSVRIDFTASEALMKPVVYINNVQAEVTGKITDWRASREITETDPRGPITFSITYLDVSGELGQAVIATTDGSGACADTAVALLALSASVADELPCEQEDDLGPLEGNWQLEFAGVGPAEGDTSWFSIADTGPDGPRACWFDDLYEFGTDGSFRNVQGNETYLETWQGVAEGCGAPVAPHDGSNNAVFEYDEAAASLKLSGLGAYLGLAKVVNGAELLTPADAPASVTYKVVELIGDNLTVRVDVGGGWWEFRLARVSNSDLVGNWKLNFAGVGPAEGDTSWFSIADTGPDGPRACWFDDIYHFGGDTSYQNFQGGETYLETWQGVAEGCGTPVTPHDGSTAGSWDYDEAGGNLRVTGLGSYLGLAKVVNGAELTTPADAPAFVNYKVVELIGDSLTVRVDVGGG